MRNDDLRAEQDKPYRPKHRASAQTGMVYGSNPLTADPDYDAAELEFMTAMERYKREKGRPFPTWGEVLAVAKSLGYRKVAEPGPLPRPGVRTAETGDS